MFDRQVIEIATKDRITTGHLAAESSPPQG